MIVRILRDLSRIAWTWSLGDRIRASPSEGAYFRIQPGDVLTVCGNDVQVVSRSLVETDDGQSISFDCHTGIGDCQLRVAVKCEIVAPQITWISNGHSEIISTNDVQVWSR